MDTETFIIERTYNAAIARVWAALTNPDQMKQWYFDIADFKAEPGFEFSFTGQGRKGEKYVHLCKVTEVIPEKKLSHTWTYEGMAGSSVVTFELRAEGEKTHLTLTHAGLESFAANGSDFAKESFKEGWTHIIGKGLADFVENQAEKN